MKIRSDPTFLACAEDEETALHYLGCCWVNSMLRHTIMGSYCLQSEELGRVTPPTFWGLLEPLRGFSNLWLHQGCAFAEIYGWPQRWVAHSPRTKVVRRYEGGPGILLFIVETVENLLNQDLSLLGVLRPLCPFCTFWDLGRWPSRSLLLFCVLLLRLSCDTAGAPLLPDFITWPVSASFLWWIVCHCLSLFCHCALLQSVPYTTSMYICTYVFTLSFENI